MKHISQYSASGETDSPKRYSVRLTQDWQAPQWILKLWAVMAVRYGQLWTNRWQDSRMLRLGQVEWMMKLEKYTEQQIVQALDKHRGEYPPSLMVLVDSCRQMPSHQRYKALPPPRADKAMALDKIQAMKRRLTR